MGLLPFGKCFSKATENIDFFVISESETTSFIQHREVVPKFCKEPWYPHSGVKGGVPS
jgi:hypothetical protein